MQRRNRGILTAAFTGKTKIIIYVSMIFIIVCSSAYIFIKKPPEQISGDPLPEKNRWLQQKDAPAVKPSTKEEQIARLDADLRRLQAFSRELENMAAEMAEINKAIGKKWPGHYTSSDHDLVENILFRYLACRSSLWDIFNFYRGYRDYFTTPERQNKGFIIGFNTALHLVYYSSVVVETFIDSSTVIKKLNEPYFRSEIPRGTYDTLFNGVTSIENLRNLKIAWQLFSNEIDDRKSSLYKISKSDQTYGAMIKQIKDFYPVSYDRIERILKKKSLLLPSVTNLLRHTAINSEVKDAKRLFGDNLYAARGVLFNNVSGLKSPLSDNILFSKEQLHKIKSILKPGDIILTFSSGYMSNLFLPGKFKHGITYVGSPQQRKAAGLPYNIESMPESKVKDMQKNLNVSKLPSGHEADLIEAVAEGVVFNSLEKITDNHLARMLVLRPRLNRQEMGKNLTSVFLLLGNVYDFKFDFSDATFHCCTEVIYRALNALGNINFTLTHRMGVETLSADDIILNYFLDKDKPLEFVLLAVKDKTMKGKRAKILKGMEGEKHLHKMMIEKYKELASGPERKY